MTQRGPGLRFSFQALPLSRDQSFLHDLTCAGYHASFNHTAIMGNDQSRSTEAEGEARPPDYYELLQITEDATDDEIKACQHTRGRLVT